MTRVIAIALLLVVTAHGQQAGPPLLTPGRPLLHAHNCYPEKGKWADRIDRALGTGVTPIVIEQDVALAMRDGTPVSVVSHDDKLTGSEPTLEEHFFKRVQPMLERAMASKALQQWPLIVLHLDFKTNEPEHHRVVLDLLKRYERFLTTAPRGDLKTIQPLAMGPLLVLTENGPGQEAAFTDATNGDRLLLFGSAPAPAASRIEDTEQRLRALAAAAPEELIAQPATNYRRWVNFSWQVVESGGQTRAGDWTNADAARLAAIVDRAHTLGYLVRFYTLNGHAAGEHPEWTASYNFGSFDAVRSRWTAAIAAGVDLVATDQYEAFAELLRRPAQTPFKAGAELVVVPVAVVDRRGQSLESLTVTDFDVREDGRPVTIQTFIPPQSAGRGAESRFVVLVLDNLRTPAELAWRVRSIAMRFVERMGPADTMTVISINRGQALTTSNKAELKAAIDRYRPAFGDTIRSFEQDASHSLRMIGSLAAQASKAPHRRKVIAVIGNAATFSPQRPSAVSGDLDLTEDWFDAVRETARQNVSVYVIDPMGQGEGAYYADHATSFSAETGGRAWANTNNFGGAVEQIWREAGSYYVLGYNAPVTDGKVHAIDVTVRVKGATVRARRGRG